MLDLEDGISDQFRQSYPELEFDDDGLLLCSNPALSCRKEGILTDDHFIRYHPILREYNLSLTDGFMEALITLDRQMTATRIRVDTQNLLDRQEWRRTITAAYIRGPRSISDRQLRDPRFPENNAGTVTEHLRTLDDEAQLFWLRDVDRLLVMWSKREALKSVQVEETVPDDAKEFARINYTVQRYVHAQWSEASNYFVHLDGAVRIYEKNDEIPLNDRWFGNHEIKPQYCKLFRVDAEMNLETWAELVNRFYYNNELMAEYLEMM